MSNGVTRKYTLTFYPSLFSYAGSVEFGCLEWKRTPEGIYMAGTDFEQIIPYHAFGNVIVVEE